MSAGNGEKTDSSTSVVRIEKKNSSADMASVLQCLQSSLTQLAEVSKAQTEAFNNLRKDLLLQPDEEDEEVDLDTTSNSLDITAATNQLLDSSNGQSPKSAPSSSRSDSEPKNDLLDSLTQALLSTSKKSPDIEGKIATLVDNILTGELSQDSVKERGEKYPPPANCKYLTTTLVNEEIWDLLSRKNRTVDLAFQRVQEPVIHGLSSLSILADRLFKDSQSAKTVNASPTQRIRPNKVHFSPEEIAIIDAEIAKLVRKKILTLVNYTPDSFISNIFIRPKKDGSHRMILNLKPLNEFVDYHHFKMDTFRTALKLIRPGCFMASVDLKDVYYSIPTAGEDRKFLMFEWKGKYHQFTCLPNGLSSAPRIFTKILKPVYAHLRSNGHTCMGHIDDSLLIGQTFHLCQQNVMDTVTLFTKLGFTVHPVKSVLQPQQKNRFFGFCAQQYHYDGNSH